MINWTISSNTLVRNEIIHIDGFIKNMLDAKVDEMIFLDGGSTDGTYERLLYYEQCYDHIHVPRWEQPKDSEFKAGFKEVKRRNLMIDASSMNFILYIDIDERINTDFKPIINKLPIRKSIKAIAFPVISMWSNYVRIDLNDDRVWFPNYKFRILRKSPCIHFASRDKNGLHNYLVINGKRVIGGFNKNSLFRAISYIYMKFIGFDYLLLSDLKIYHFHYYNLNIMKINDLRKTEYSNQIKICQFPEEGKKYCLNDKIIPVIEIKDVKLKTVIERYL